MNSVNIIFFGARKHVQNTVIFSMNPTTSVRIPTRFVARAIVFKYTYSVGHRKLDMEVLSTTLVNTDKSIFDGRMTVFPIQSIFTSILKQRNELPLKF